MAAEKPKGKTNQEIEQLTKEVALLSEATEVIVIENDDDLKAATDLLSAIKTKGKLLTAKKSAILGPIKKAVDEIKDLFKTPEERLAAAESAVKDAMLAYHEKKDAAAQKQIESIENRIGPGRGKLKVETAMAQLAAVDQADTNIRTANGGAQFRQGPEKVRITDVRLLIEWHGKDLLNRPRVLEALRLEITADVKAGAPVPEGAEVYREKIVAGMAS